VRMGENADWRCAKSVGAIDSAFDAGVDVCT